MTDKPPPTSAEWSVGQSGAEQRFESPAAIRAAADRVRAALPPPPPPGLPGGGFRLLAPAPLPAAAAFLVRCHARAGFLAVRHPALGPPIRRAMLVGLAACRGTPGVPGDVLEAQWGGLVAAVARLATGPAAAPLGCGPGQAALVAANLLGALAEAPARPPGEACRPAAEDVLAAFWASSPGGARDADRAAVSAALAGDLDVLAGTAAGPAAGIDPGPAGPFGRLWPRGTPFLTDALTPDGPSALLPLLTDVRTTPILARMAGEVQKGQSLTGKGEPEREVQLTRPPLDAWVEALRDLRGRVVAASEPFRAEFLDLLAAARGRSFHESNAVAAAEINALLGLLGLEFRDPDDHDQTIYLRCKRVPGTRGGAFELRSRADGKQRIIHSRTSLPDRLDIGDGPGRSEQTE